MKVAVYIRSASEGTAQAQHAQLEEWTLREGYQVVAVYTDDGMPGTTLLHDRPAGRRLLDEIRDRNVKTVVVSALDRLSRTPAGVLMAVEEIHERGASVRAVKEGFDSRSPLGRLFLNTLAVVADWESGSDA